MAVDPTELYALIRLVRPLYRTLYRVVEEGLAGSGITVAQRAVLETLDEEGPLTVPHIARTLDLGRQPVQRSVDGLLADGRIEARPNPAHRRSRLLALTPAGREAMAAIRSREMALIAAVGAGLEPDELRVAVRLLREVEEGFRGPG